MRNRCRNLTLNGFPDRQQLAGRQRDVDIRNHINNIAVAELFSEARARFIQSLMPTTSRVERQFFVVGQQAVAYIDEAHYPGRIDIGTGLFMIGRSSLRIGQAFFNNDRCTAICEAVLVFSNGGRVDVLPPQLIERARGYVFGDAGALPRQLAAEAGWASSDNLVTV